MTSPSSSRQTNMLLTHTRCFYNSDWWSCSSWLFDNILSSCLKVNLILFVPWSLFGYFLKQIKCHKSRSGSKQFSIFKSKVDQFVLLGWFTADLFQILTKCQFVDEDIFHKYRASKLLNSSFLKNDNNIKYAVIHVSLRIAWLNTYGDLCVKSVSANTISFMDPWTKAKMLFQSVAFQGKRMMPSCVSRGFKSRWDLSSFVRCCHVTQSIAIIWFSECVAGKMLSWRVTECSW